MTLVEFLAPLPRGTHRDRVLAVMYYAEQVEGVSELTIAEIRDRLAQARVKSAKAVNLSDVLGKAGANVNRTRSPNGAGFLWSLTDTGRHLVEDTLGLAPPQSEKHHDVRSLRQLAAGISDEVVRGYIEEAVLCLEIDALRASVVFLWTAAIRQLQEDALSKHRAKDITAALQKHDPKARAVSKVEDFANIKDSTALLAFRTLGVLDKGEWSTLDGDLDLRNRCGHPTKYRPGEKKAAAFIEDVIGIAFT